MLGSLLHKLYGPVVVEDRVSAPPEEVYGVVADPETYPDWLVGAERIRSVDPDFPRPGAAFEHSVGPTDPVTIDDRSESIAAEPDRHLALQVHAGPFHARVDFELEPAGAAATTIRFSEQPTGAVAVLTPLLRASLRHRNELSLRQLKDQMGNQVVT